jgi:hypothetical protein
MGYNPFKITSMFSNSDEPVEVKSEGHSLIDIITTMSIARPLITANLSELVNSHIEAQENKKDLKKQIIEQYVKYKIKNEKERLDNSPDIDAIESESETLNSIRNFATKFIDGVSVFFESIIVPIVSVAWSALTTVLGFISTTLMEFVLVPIAEVVTALVIANPIAWGIAGTFVLVAGGYWIYKRATGGSIAEDVKTVKELTTVSRYTAPVAEAESNLFSPKTEEPVLKPTTFGRKKNRDGFLIVKETETFTGGVIKGLTEAETNKLANVTAFRESSNQLDKINSLGYVGLYQMGDSALVDAGYVSSNRYKKYRHNYKNRLEFLSDKENWNIGSLPEFLNSKEMQDDAFSKLANSNIKLASVITKSNSEQLAGFIMGAHLLGAGKAKLYFSLDAAGRAAYDADKKNRDANNTKMLEYVLLGISEMTKFHNQEATTRNTDNFNTKLPDPVVKLTVKPSKDVTDKPALPNSTKVNQNTEIIKSKAGLLKVAN